jgi:hypothetical protein
MSIILRTQEREGRYLQWIQVADDGTCEIFETDTLMTEEEAQTMLQEYLDGITQQ